MPEGSHHTYVLRIWTEREHSGPPAFRATLTDVASRQTLYFTDERALSEHLALLTFAPEGGEGR